MAEFKGPNIVGKIDLSKFEKKLKINFEKMSSFFKEKLRLISLEVNNEFGDILEPDATIKIVGNDSGLHKKVVSIKEEVWASEKNCTVSEYQEKRDRDPATVSEMFITSILHKALKDRFLVARASAYDDYENGIDYVLIDKETGAVVCGFDQVLGMGKEDGSTKKKDKIDRILLRGGAKLEYGITFDQDKKLIRKKLKNIPIFFLALSKEDLDKALDSLQKDNNLDSSIINDFSKDILKKMIKSLEEQSVLSDKLIEGADDQGKYRELLVNIDKFKESLEIIKSKINL